MKISLNCPSYKRPYVETLEYLPFCKVWVCESEYEEYKKQNTGGEIVSVPYGVQGNVCRIRNWILDREFEAGNDVVVIIDDDMKGMYRYFSDGVCGYNKKLIAADEYMDFLEHFSILCDEFGFKLWGVNSNIDPMSYRHFAPFSTTNVVLGPFSAHLKNGIRYDVRLPLKEDYDLSLQHFLEYRGILRANMYHYDVKQSEQKGGCATYRNMSKEAEQFLLLQRKWGSKIIKYDNKSKKSFDYNPIVKVPIKGV